MFKVPLRALKHLKPVMGMKQNDGSFWNPTLSHLFQYCFPTHNMGAGECELLIPSAQNMGGMENTRTHESNH